MRNPWKNALGLVLGMALLAIPAAAKAPAQSGPDPASRAEGKPEPADRLIVLAADPWCPYNCDPQADGQEGYMVDVARAVFEPLGYRVEYRLMSWTQALRMAEDGKVHGLVGAGETDFADLIFPAHPLGLSENAIATRRGHAFAWKGPASLAGHRMAVIKDYSYGSVLDPYIEEHADDPSRVTVLSGFGYALLNQSLRGLVEGRYDLVPEDANVLAWGLRRMKLEERVAQHPLNDGEPVHIGFPKGQPRSAELARLMTRGIEGMRRDGTLAAILARYGLTDWQPAQAAR
ncbi:MAG TPA: transporter substrate-binding domain-containing protein [Azospirillaceae bacterium]|nr:transporter substrate-binding domain-containing protein [Azospirillaceae bacterium]